MPNPNDSHLSNSGRTGNEDAPIKQHHRMALGEKVNGQSNPFGAAKASTDNKVRNGSGKTY